MAMMEDLEELVLLPIAKTTMGRAAEIPLARANGLANKDFAGTGLGMVDVLDTTSTTAVTTILLT